MFLSADDERPKTAIDDGFAVADSLFTYAIGKLVLWSRVVDVTNGEAALKAGDFQKLSIANPVAAPYGAAAVETMKALGVYDALQAEDRPGQQHRAGVPVRRHRQCRTGLRRAVAAHGRDGGDALGGSAESLYADPSGRRAVEDRARTTRRRTPSSPS